MSSGQTIYHMLVAEACAPSAPTLYTLPMYSSLADITASIQGNYQAEHEATSKSRGISLSRASPTMRFYVVAHPHLRAMGVKFVEIRNCDLNPDGHKKLVERGFPEWEVRNAVAEDDKRMRGNISAYPKRDLYIRVFAVEKIIQLKDERFLKEVLG